jgi:hypothetical protein
LHRLLDNIGAAAIVSEASCRRRYRYRVASRNDEVVTEATVSLWVIGVLGIRVATTDRVVVGTDQVAEVASQVITSYARAVACACCATTATIRSSAAGSLPVVHRTI